MRSVPDGCTAHVSGSAVDDELPGRVVLSVPPSAGAHGLGRDYRHDQPTGLMTDVDDSKETRCARLVSLTRTTKWLARERTMTTCAHWSASAVRSHRMPSWWPNIGPCVM